MWVGDRPDPVGRRPRRCRRTSVRAAPSGVNATSGPERPRPQLTPRLARLPRAERRKLGKADRRARKRENKLQGRAEREAEVKRAKQRSGMIRGGIAALVIVAIFGAILLSGHKSSKKTTPTTVKAGCSTVNGRISCTQPRP